MTSFVVVEVAIGLVFTYLLLAVLCTAINEWIARVLRLRPKYLKSSIKRLVDHPDHAGKENRLSDAIYAHPLVRSLKAGSGDPSYIPSDRFVAAMRDVISTVATRSTLAPADLNHVETQLAAVADQSRNVPNPMALPAAAPKDPFESWFEDAMERASGWYKRRLMTITLVVAAGLTVAMNADTFDVARTLWHDPALRAAVVAQATERAKQPPPTIIDTSYPNPDVPIAPEVGKGSEAEAVTASTSTADNTSPGLTDDERALLSQLIGWSADLKKQNAPVCRARQQAINEACRVGVTPTDVCTKQTVAGTADGVCEEDVTGLVATDALNGDVLSGLLGHHFLGWFITVMAVSMGAPFWFDLLQRFVNIRAAGQPPKPKTAN